MKTMKLLVLALSAVGMNAYAATICVKNEKTGQYESTSNRKCGRSDSATQRTTAAAGDKYLTDDAVESQEVEKKKRVITIVQESIPAVDYKKREVKEYPVEQKMAKVWSIRKTDGSIFKALSRWSKDAQWQLQWETDKKDFPVIFEANYSGEFEDGILGVMTSLKNSQYPLRACFYNNNAVRIIHKSKDCLDK
ncbi:Toxin co-regulated pilus biosynthesis protein Q (plasmid) [Janthinobacterium sp. HH102]|uniref:TcpQ domain-containing protein n=1 Tax=Janthinobacterium sp. HH102 TaxID=1537274 RepID=UPI0008931160|nr:TcpQ domain-containing protein [Janthinobacterium sp. HH102]QOU76433.1 Toxin co-regulated pilus biosynthesis protein Q [Janthinobacterium sp. HH102]